jgi:hypothetical protein
VRTGLADFSPLSAWPQRLAFEKPEIEAVHVLEAGNLPSIHQDPFEADPVVDVYSGVGVHRKPLSDGRRA